MLTQIHPKDTVAVALRAIPAGAKLRVGSADITALQEIPPGHKVALVPIPKGTAVIKYGFPIGRATADIPAGSHVHVHNVETLLTETAEYRYTPKPPAPAARGDPVSIQAYKRPGGEIGVRNELWVIPAVGCVNKTAEILARWAHSEFAGKGIDAAAAWTHPYGCSQMGADHETTRRILADLALHPNAGGVLVVGLGCENNTMDSFKALLAESLPQGALDSGRFAFMVTQNCADEIAEGKALLKKLFGYASTFKREDVDASRLILGMKCGGSDGFSGITANALAGRVSDALSALGGTAVLTEVPEMFGAEHMLMDRCVSRAVFDKTVSLITDFKAYFTGHGQVVYENPSPGNKDGGITTLEDKSCGCVQKGGQAPVKAVFRYGERIPADPGSGGGVVLLEGPGNDIVSTTALTAAGCHLILFTTGRGTPLGAPVPTIKIATNSDLAARKSGWIDFDAGRLLTEDPDNITREMLSLVWDTASGKTTKNEQNGYREIGIFKSGVTV
jgi:altronate hydrolase